MPTDPGGPPTRADSSASPPAFNLEQQIAMALARAAARALLEPGSETAARMRAQLRKEAVALDMRPGAEAQAAAAAIRRMLDGA